MKYFLYDHFGSLNRGCEAIVRGTENIIKKADENAAFHLCSYSPETDADLGLPLGSMAPRDLEKKEHYISALNVKLLKSERYALGKMYSPVVEQAAGADLCLCIGGDTYCYGDNTVSREISYRLKKSGKKTVLWGASIGKEDLSSAKIEALKNFDAVFARESITYSMLKGIVNEKKLFWHADPAFAMEKEELSLPSGFEDGNTLGFNISPLVIKRNKDLFSSSAAFLKNVIDATDMQIALIPHVTAPHDNDCEVLKDLYDELNSPSRVVLLPGDLNARQYKGYISRLRFFIGARTHATIAAYSSCVPTIVLGYSVKSRGIAQDLFSKEKFVINSAAVSDYRTLDYEFSALVEQEDEIKEHLKKIIPVKVKSAYDAGLKFRQIIK